MSEFISDIEVASLIQQFGITDVKQSEDGRSQIVELGNGESITQPLGPQNEYSGTLEVQTDPAEPAAEPAPTIDPAAALDAQTSGQEADTPQAAADRQSQTA